MDTVKIRMLFLSCRDENQRQRSSLSEALTYVMKQVLCGAVIYNISLQSIRATPSADKKQQHGKRSSRCMKTLLHIGTKNIRIYTNHFGLFLGRSDDAVFFQNQHPIWRYIGCFTIRISSAYQNTYCKSIDQKNRHHTLNLEQWTQYVLLHAQNPDDTPIQIPKTEQKTTRSQNNRRINPSFRKWDGIDKTGLMTTISMRHILPFTFSKIPDEHHLR